MFSNEFIFRASSDANKQDVRILGAKQPEEHNPVLLSSPGVLEMRAFSKAYFVGPFLRSESVRNETYRKMKNDYAFPKPRSLTKKYPFRRDDPFPYHSNKFITYLKSRRLNNCILNSNFASLPPSCPDLIFRFHFMSLY